VPEGVAPVDDDLPTKREAMTASVAKAVGAPPPRAPTDAVLPSSVEALTAAVAKASSAAVPQQPPARAPGKRPTLRDVVAGDYSQWTKRWAKKDGSAPDWEPAIVDTIYKQLRLSGFDSGQVMALEFNSYLERYLWPFLDVAEATLAHLMSVMLLVNAKVLDGITAWESIGSKREKFAGFFERALELWKSDSLNLRERSCALQFLINCFQSLEQEFVRECCLKLTGLQSWFHLNDLHREKLLALNKKLPAFWKKVQKKYSVPKTQSQRFERNFMAELLDEFLADLERFGEQETLGNDELNYVERFVELMIDLLNQLPTRRFFRPILVDKHFVVRCKRSKVAQQPLARLFNQLLSILRYYENFEIDDTTGRPLSRRDVTDLHYEKLQLLQRVCFQDFGDTPAMRKIAVANVSALDSRDSMMEHLSGLPLDVLKVLCAKVCYLDVSKDATLAAMEQKVKDAHDEAERLAAEKENVDGQKPKKKRKKKIKTEEEQRLIELLLEIIVSRLERPGFQQDEIEKMPLYPTEELVWDPHLVPEEHYAGDYSLALPKLNLQFLTIHDYLLRNFNLFRLESTYEIRENLHDQLPRTKAVQDPNVEGRTQFNGKARMCLPMASIEIMNVKRPKVGESVPAEVRAEVRWCLTGCLPHVRGEWDQLREHDVIFLLTIDAPEEVYEGKPNELSVADFPVKFGVTTLRGCEITELLDDEGNVISDPNPGNRQTPVGDNRIARVLLDPAQYHMDLEATADGKRSDVYSSLNLIMRRKPKENNFKAILQTIRSLMSSEDTVVPDWLHDLFLGYGDPGAAQYWKLPTALSEIDFLDTFLDQDHILESFPDAEDIEMPDELPRPFKLKFEKTGGEVEAGKQPPENVIVSGYTLPNMGPYPECMPNENKVRFTPTQVEAIRSGVNPGLTMVVGPPGTGKTDTAVQVVNLLFHNFPDQKIVLIAHSNQALNDLFEKIVALDIPERYLLRLGRGIEELDLKTDYSKWGRVNHMLQRRLELLGKVERLAETFAITGADAAYTCENAQHFFLHHVVYRWEEFQKKLRIAGEDGANLARVMPRKKRAAPKAAQSEVKKAKKAKRADGAEEEEEEEEDEAEAAAAASAEAPAVQEAEHDDELAKAQEQLRSGSRTVVSFLFPYTPFFADAPQPLFPGKSYAEDLEIATGCFRYFENMFKQIEECHAFELLRNSHDRGNYLITTHARIIAMTCTHAALKRADLCKLSFKYDNLIMEESAQILEVETFIPLLLQQSERGVSRLKRVMLIGDHHQLPPVVKNRAFQKYGHLDQSLYTRFVRLRTPTVDLNLQGRARPDIADLYSWRYRGLGNLPMVLTDPSYRVANPGLSHEYQFINVDDFDGQGEFQPTPFFYQNLGEAEYCVALFMFMRLMGIPSTKISILSTYNGQKALIRDVVKQRCAWNPLFGEPGKITTVDKFQGQQNDYIIVSLVRTKAVGHLRDVRRLVVTMSRARLGLYVFGRFSIFENCFELTPVFSRFAKLPLDLTVELEDDSRPEPRKTNSPANPTRIRDVKHMWEVLQDHMKAQFQRAASQVQGLGIAGAAPAAVGPATT